MNTRTLSMSFKQISDMAKGSVLFRGGKYLANIYQRHVICFYIYGPFALFNKIIIRQFSAIQLCKDIFSLRKTHFGIEKKSLPQKLCSNEF